MKSASGIALVTALALGGSAFLPASPAEAQRRAPAAAPVPAPQPVQPYGGRVLSLSRDERIALQALDAALRGGDRAAQDAALAAAQSTGRSADARYAAARYQIELGRARQDIRLQSAGMDALVASGAAQPEEVSAILAVQASLAYNAGEYRAAAAALTRSVELRPNDPAVLTDLAQVQMILGNRAAAVANFQRAIAARQAAGQVPTQALLRRALAAAYDGRLAPQSIALGRTLVAAYPSPINWRDTLLVLRDVGGLTGGAELDAMRLMRAAQAMGGERDYQQLAEALIRAGLFAEARAVLSEGVSRRMIDAGRSPFREMIADTARRATAERSGLAAAQSQAQAAATGTLAMTAGEKLLGQGQYAEAAALFRSALLKGGVDADEANTRLGIALALGGQRGEAEAAFRAVTGARADLASYWLVWLSQRQPA